MYIFTYPALRDKTKNLWCANKVFNPGIKSNRRMQKFVSNFFLRTLHHYYHYLGPTKNWTAHANAQIIFGGIRLFDAVSFPAQNILFKHSQPLVFSTIFRGTSWANSSAWIEFELFDLPVDYNLSFSSREQKCDLQLPGRNIQIWSNVSNGDQAKWRV